MSTAIPFKFFSKFSCFHCFKKFTDFEDLKDHTMTEHPVCDLNSKSIQRCIGEQAVVRVDVSYLACKFCDESMDDLETLIDHLISKHDVNYDKTVTGCFEPFWMVKDNIPCPHCDVSFTYFATLVRHINAEHCQANKICNFCGRSFRRASNLGIHISYAHTGTRACKMCGFIFKNQWCLARHNAKVHDVKDVKCPKCSEQFQSQYHKQKHLILIHNVGHKCSYCERMFTRNSFLRDHIRRVHLKVKTVMSNKYHLKKMNLARQRCTSTDILTNINDELIELEKRRNNLQLLFINTSITPFKWRGRFQCFYCSYDDPEFVRLKDHTRSHSVCETQEILGHIKKAHGEIKIDVSEVTCKLCDSSFKSLVEIVNHLIGIHNLEYHKDVDMSLQEYMLAESRCQYCVERFAYFGYLITHINNVHPQNSFACDECGITFNNKRALYLHIRHTHRQGGYPCDECPQIFETRGLMEKHMSTSHFRKCKTCNLTFPSNILLKKHRVTEHFDNKCPHCEKQFQSRRGLILHLRACKFQTIKRASKSKQNSEVLEPRKKAKNLPQKRQNIVTILNMSTVTPFRFYAKFSCFHCSEQFTEFEDLKEHTVSEHPICDMNSKCIKKWVVDGYLVRVDVSDITCKVCNKTMDSLDNLVDHLITEHDADYDKLVTNCFEPFEMTKEHIKCPHCTDVFQYFATLVRHINAEHCNSLKCVLQICDFCGRTFRRAANLAAHIVTAHTSSHCDVCGLNFKNQACLARHNAKVHDVKGVKCPKCPELFQSQYHKQKHMIEVHDIGHKCHHCGRMFTRNSFLKDHIRRIHLKGKLVVVKVSETKDIEAE